jgi:hypothetical protein
LSSHESGFYIRFVLEFSNILTKQGLAQAVFGEEGLVDRLIGKWEE